MSISEAQLQTWCGQGAVTGSVLTHTSVRNALAAHSWPQGMRYEVYLQGSYANTTNIRADSDVDVVVECTSVFYSNLEDHEKQLLGLSVGRHSYSDFRREVLSALTSYYGHSLVHASGANAIEVLPASNRLKADVLPCVSYHHYQALQVAVEGVAFWNQHTSQQVKNFPKLHIRHGEQKNGSDRTNGRYKPSVRMFKNARRQLVENDESLRKRYPSYFVECLLYNALDECYSNSAQQTFAQAVIYLSNALRNGTADHFKTQSGCHELFGASVVQWSKENASDFVSRLITMWGA